MRTMFLMQVIACHIFVARHRASCVGRQSVLDDHQIERDKGTLRLQASKSGAQIPACRPGITITCAVTTSRLLSVGVSLPCMEEAVMDTSLPPLSTRVIESVKIWHSSGSCMQAEQPLFLYAVSSDAHYRSWLMRHTARDSE